MTDVRCWITLGTCWPCFSCLSPRTGLFRCHVSAHLEQWRGPWTPNRVDIIMSVARDTQKYMALQRGWARTRCQSWETGFCLSLLDARLVATLHVYFFFPIFISTLTSNPISATLQPYLGGLQLSPILFHCSLCSTLQHLIYTYEVARSARIIKCPRTAACLF